MSALRDPFEIKEELKRARSVRFEARVGGVRGGVEQTRSLQEAVVVFLESPSWALPIHVLGVFRRADLDERFEVRTWRAEGVHFRLARAIPSFLEEYLSR